MSCKHHAMTEFKAAGWVDEDGNWDSDHQKELCKDVLELLDLFFEAGHSGSSAPYAISLFTKLAKFKPITPLTGEDREWNKVEGNSYQNNRCSSVFKDGDGKAYDIDGKVFRYPDGGCYINIDSSVYIEFPYTPKTEYVDAGPGESRSVL